MQPSTLLLELWVYSPFLSSWIGLDVGSFFVSSLQWKHFGVSDRAWCILFLLIPCECLSALLIETSSFSISVIGFPLISAVLLIEALLQQRFLGTTNKAGNGAAVAIIYLFVVLYQLVDVPSYVWCAEIFPTTIRAKGMGIAMFVWFVGFITFCTPGAQSFRTMWVFLFFLRATRHTCVSDRSLTCHNVVSKWKTYLIYMALCLVAEVLTYYLIPETKGKPIEEIGALFGDEVALHMTANGEGILEKPEGIQLQVVETAPWNPEKCLGGVHGAIPFCRRIIWMCMCYSVEKIECLDKKPKIYSWCGFSVETVAWRGGTNIVVYHKWSNWRQIIWSWLDDTVRPGSRWQSVSPSFRSRDTVSRQMVMGLWT